MLKYHLTEDQALLQGAADRYFRDRYGFRDRQAIVASAEGFDPVRWRDFAELGWLGVALPERFGGSENAIADLVLLLQTFGKYLVVEPYLSTIMGALALVNAGSERHSSQLLPEVVQGRLQLALAFAERPHGYSLNEIDVTAREKGLSYELNGNKAVVLGAPSADYIIVAARTAGERRDRAGISLLLVRPHQQGVALRGYRTIDGRRAADISFSNVTVPAEDLIGEAGAGLEPLRKTVATATLALLGEALGAMDGALERTVEYLNIREQFGVKLASFQVLRHRVADMVATNEEAGGLVRRATRVHDGLIAGNIHEEVAAAKAYIGQYGMTVCKESVQLNGGIALTEEYIVGHYLKRLIAVDRMFGGVEHQMDTFLNENSAFRI